MLSSFLKQSRTFAKASVSVTNEKDFNKKPFVCSEAEPVSRRLNIMIMILSTVLS